MAEAIRDDAFIKTLTRQVIKRAQGKHTGKKIPNSPLGGHVQTALPDAGGALRLSSLLAGNAHPAKR